MLISNTGPLVALGLLGHLEILRKLFPVITVADSVRREVTASAHKPVSGLFADHPWIQVRPDPPMPDIWLATVLDAGEAATIALAVSEHPTSVLIDERKGRRIAAQIYGLPVIGTAGILLRAKARGLIPAVRPLLLELKAKGYHLQSQLIDQISAAAGE
jgi:predicted nucleic acid-binding protein